MMNRIVLVFLLVVVVAVAAVASGLWLWGRGGANPEWTTDSPRALEAYELAIDATQKLYWAEARAHLERAVELDPNFAMAQLNLLWMRDRGASDALGTFLRSVDVDSLTDRESMLVRYFLAHVEGEHDRAESLLNAYLVDHPDDPYALNASCDEAWVRLDWDRAERCYQHLIERHPNWVEAQRRLGYMAMGQGRFDEAEERFQAYRYVAPDQANPHDSLGELRMLLGRYDEAREAFRAALVNKADFCPSHENLSRLAVFEGDAGAARAALETMAQQEACRKHAARLTCYIEMMIQFTQGDFTAAREAQQACAEKLPNSVLAHRVALLTGHEREALAMELALREDFEARNLGGPLEKQWFRSAALHFEGARLMASGNVSAAVTRLAEADDLITYWGDGRWSFKLVNRMDWAGALSLLGREQDAVRLRAEIDQVNPHFADIMGPASTALAGLAESHRASEQ